MDWGKDTTGETRKQLRQGRFKTKETRVISASKEEGRRSLREVLCVRKKKKSTSSRIDQGSEEKKTNQPKKKGAQPQEGTHPCAEKMMCRVPAC